MHALEAKFVVVGTGRCGTGYVSKCFTACGIPCGHERLFTPNGCETIDDALVGDASWLAVPHLAAYDGYVIHVHRHPYDCVASLFACRGLTTPAHLNAWGEFLRREYGTPKDYTDASLYSYLARFWRDWNIRCSRFAHMSVGIKNFSFGCVARVAAELGLPSVDRVATISKGTNSCKHPRLSRWAIDIVGSATRGCLGYT